MQSSVGQDRMNDLWAIAAQQKELTAALCHSIYTYANGLAYRSAGAQD